MPIVWSEDAKKYLVPTRLEHVAGTARPKPAAMWKGARKEYTRAHAYWAKGPDQAPPATKKNLTTALELLASDTAPEALAYDEVLAAASFIAPTIVWWVLAREGLVRALRVVLKANEFDRGHGRGAAWIVPAGLDSKFVFAPEAMRTWYLLADREEQDAARALAGKVWEHARPAVRAGLVLMIPEQHAWARELATTWQGPLARNLADGLLASIDDIALVPQVLKLGGAAAGVVNVVDRFGEAAVGVLSKVIEETEHSHEAKHSARALTLIRTRESGEALASHLGRAVVRPFAAEFFAAEPEIARAVLPAYAKGKKKVAQVAAEMLTRVERAEEAAASAGVGEAAAEALPRVLGDPPWRAAKRPRRKRGVVAGLTMLDYPERLAVERSVLLAAAESRSGAGHLDSTPMNEEELAKYLEKSGDVNVRSHFPYDWTMQRVVPEPERVRVWNEAGPGLGRSFGAAGWMHATYGLAPLPGTVVMMAKLLVRAWAQKPETVLLAALDTPKIAPSVARALAEPRMASLAKTWLLANPERAAIGLIPTAVGSDGKERDAAERALRYVAGRGHAEVLRGAGKRYGADAARALDEVLDWDPLWDCPSKPPKMPPYWRVAELTRPRLRDGSPLPLPAVEALDEMLAFTQVDPPYAGIADVVAACDPRSLAEHAWDLATTWEQNRAKDSHGWMIDALVHLADEEVVRRTTPALKSPRVVQVLGRIGTDAAAMELATIVSRIQARGQATTYGIGAAAEKQLDEIAGARGLDPEAFEDRITPTLDVDDAGGLTLDYGGRTLRVAFDEKLEPYVTDDDGGRLKNLPPGRKTDDKKKVKAAQQAWKDLREDVRVIADRRIAALERAMSTQRAWTPEAFRAAFVDHPLMLHLTRRIVWAARDAGGALLGTFRVAEDRSYADARDDHFALPDDAKITIPHPSAWPDETLADWRTVLADYQLLQPFPQLDRPEPALDAAALAGTDVTRERAPRAEGAPNNGTRLTQLGWTYKQISGALAYRKTLEDGGAVQASWQPKDEHAGGPLPITLSHVDSKGEKRPLAALPRHILADAYYDLYLRA